VDPIGLSSEGNSPSTWGTGVKMAIHKSVCRQQTRVELGHGLEPVAERLQYTGQTGRPLYSFYRPTEGGRLSRRRQYSKAAQPVPGAAYSSSCRDKHNRPRCDSNLSHCMQSDALITRLLRLDIVFLRR